MALQIGTVDGLINISEDKIMLLVKAIQAFSKEGLEYANRKDISPGTAFQRFCEPVYKGDATEFDIGAIDVPVYTKGGKEQSPAKVTYCKKMGLLHIDNNGVFKLTDVAESIWSDELSVQEYTLLLLSKQGCFINDNFTYNLFAVLGDWFKTNYQITEADLKNYLIRKFEDNDIVKTRLDIILNALIFCGILKDVKPGVYVLADLYAGIVLNSFVKNRTKISPSLLDTNPNYSQFMGSFSGGIFDVYNPEIADFAKTKFPHLHRIANSIINRAFVSPRKELACYLRAMRTKPFLLLAGISGTGKSRIVKQMAFDSCPINDSLRKDATTPGNYCLIEVKPNWHDSSELIGYASQIGRPHYVVTPFVRFLAKALLYEEQRVPFFVCLDEMNLAPVEQYFAEFLSVLESRKAVNGRITSEALIPAEIFADARYEHQLKEDLFGLQVKKVIDDAGNQVYEGELPDDELKVYRRLAEEGLRIPSNLIVVGTVNMDETTHQFSRKVIDRAMTIEMNLPEGDPFMDFFNNSRDLDYTDMPLSADLFLPSIVKAADAVDALAAANAEETDLLKKEVAKILKNLNDALEDTPFKIAYRVQNELMLYFHELWKENREAEWSDILNKAVDQIMIMKVLPRVEGDEDMLEKPLAKLADFCATGNYRKAAQKVSEMKNRLDRSHFTSFWP